MKKLFCLAFFTVMVLLSSITVLAAAQYDGDLAYNTENGGAVTEEYDGGEFDAHAGIDYSGSDIIIPGEGMSDFSINLTKETITIPSAYNVAAYSRDGGKSWLKAKASTFSDEKFPLLLNKGVTLQLSDKAVNSKKRQPEEGAVIVSFPTINARPGAPKLVINYLIAADKTGATPGEWVLTVKNGTTAVKEDIQIGVADKKKVDDEGFGKFPEGAANGLPVMALTKNKVVKTSYYIRIAPKQEGSTYTAASKQKKILVQSESKRPSHKISSKTKTIKINAGTYVSINGGTPMLYPSKDEISGTGTIELWRAATVKKPASAKQMITGE